MWPVVHERWFNINAPLEGVVAWMYLDIKGLVTTGVGNYLPDARYASTLPWVRKDTLAEASQQEVMDEYGMLESRKDLAKLGHTACAGITRLRLTGEGMHKLVMSKFNANAVLLKKRYPDIDTWPAAAQVAVSSLAWACGPHYKFPKLDEALAARDWGAAAVQIHMNEYTTGPHGEQIKNAGLVPRNKMNKALMLEALAVETLKLDPSELHWPKEAKLVEPYDQPIVHDMDSYFPERNEE